jgi:hypothetical protein
MAQACPPSVQACKTRTVLTLQQALHIFQIKQSNPPSQECGRRSAAAVARSFGVSEKTIRDIWIGRTWVREMMHLDPARAAKAGGLKLPGRPTKRSKTEENDKSCLVVHLSSTCLIDRNIDFNSESAFCPAVSASPEGTQDLPSQHTLAMNISKASNSSADAADPFHDDWPHWAAGNLWEQHAAEDGYLIHPTAFS